MISEVPALSRFRLDSDRLVLPPGAFRLVLAAAVLMSHLSAIDVGRLAVLLFFYLSGYWTALIWRQKFGPGSTLRFYAARFLRIFPLYLLTVLAAALLRGMPLHLENLTLFGVAATHRDPTGVSWSLDVELQFYVLLPFIAAAVASAPTWISIALSLAVGAAGWWLNAHYDIATVAKYLPAFVLGTITFAKAWRPSARASAVSLLGFAAMTALTGLTPFLSKRTPDPFDQDVWGLIWMLPLLPYVARSLTVRSSKLDRHFGNLSYPLYLVHFMIVALALDRFGSAMWVKGLAAMASCAVAVAIYVLVDRPVDRWRVRMTETPKTPAPQPSLS